MARSAAHYVRPASAGRDPDDLLWLSEMADDFDLYEALLWEPGQGYFLLDAHLRRLARSASHFGHAADVEAIRSHLMAVAEEFSPGARKVRFEVSKVGEFCVEVEFIESSSTVSYALAGDPVDSSNVLLGHKTSRRAVYERALAAQPDAEDVVLWNERGELTESCHANLVLEIQGQRLTPHVDCGLLPGTFRAHLLERGEIEEAVLPVEQIQEAQQVFLINSVRRWRRATSP